MARPDDSGAGGGGAGRGYGGGTGGSGGGGGRRVGGVQRAAVRAGRGEPERSVRDRSL